MTLSLQPTHVQELVEKNPGRPAREVLRGTGLKLPHLDAHCRALFGLTFAEARKAFVDATRASTGRGQMRSWYIPGPSRGGKKSDRDSPYSG